MKGCVMPSFLPCRIARRMILRSTYPRHSLLGMTPSAMRNVLARMWSAITRIEVLAASSPTYGWPHIVATSCSSGWNRSVS